MTNRDRILEFIRRFPGRDDDEISSALSIKPRQSVNQSCRALERGGLVKRRTGPMGKVLNYPNMVKDAPAVADTVPIPAPLDRRPSSGVPQEWYWEGHVTDALANFLVAEGWSILSQAETSTREGGLDLHVARGERQIVVEAKGYPTTTYRDPARAGETKPTSPTLQAQHWYAQALLKALRLQAAHSAATVAIALPDMPRYRGLVQETSAPLRRLDIALFFVREDRTVEAIGL